jgi:methyl coenzyme M reductase subunit C-like uncharacterized protein (methanogenesis marker protein 7)
VILAMLLDEVFERFMAESPLVVMLRVVLEQSLSAEEVDQLFVPQRVTTQLKGLLYQG